MIKSLEAGELPPLAPLKQRLKVAMVKKAGILRQPRPCWSADTKINPNSSHLLWAAVLVEDGEEISLAAGFMSMEIQAGRPDVTTGELVGILGDQLSALVRLAPAEKLQKELQARVDRARTSLPGL